MRRLPIYVLLDTSESMAGELLQALGMGLKALISELKSDPLAIETIWLSVITFGGEARQVFPLTELMNLPPIELRATGLPCLGDGLRTLVEAIAHEVDPGNDNRKGDWLSAAFIFIGSTPSDEWLMPARIVQAMTKSKIINEPVVAAAGPGLNLTIFKEFLSECTVDLSNLQPGSLKSFFRWDSLDFS